MNKLYCTFFILTLLLLSLISNAQQDFSALAPVDMKYKKMIKTAKDNDQLMLFVSYNPETVSNSIFLIEDPSKAIKLQEKVITSVLDITEDSRHEVFKRFRIYSNPFYLFLNSDEILLAQGKAINSYDDLITLYGQAIIKDREYVKLKNQIDTNKNSQAQKEMIVFILGTNDESALPSYIDEWINDNFPFKAPEDFAFMADVAQLCTCSRRVGEAIEIYGNELIKSMGINRYLNLRKNYILKDLRESGYMDPYTVWEAYDRQLGIHADSMYRQFAIEYYQVVEPDQNILLDELYDFLYYYPLTPWEQQDQYFEKAVKFTKSKEDLPLLLDLIEYQIYLEDHYRKQDFKALILYKMGKVDRAIALMNAVESSNPGYQSMLHQLTE